MGILQFKTRTPTFEVQINKKMLLAYKSHIARGDKKSNSISNFETHTNNRNAKYRVSSSTHNFKPALQSQQSWIRMSSLFLWHVFLLSEGAGTFYRKLSWHTRHCEVPGWLSSLALFNASRSAYRVSLLASWWCFHFVSVTGTACFHCRLHDHTSHG